MILRYLSGMSPVFPPTDPSHQSTDMRRNNVIMSPFLNDSSRLVLPSKSYWATASQPASSWSSLDSAQTNKHRTHQHHELLQRSESKNKHLSLQQVIKHWTYRHQNFVWESFSVEKGQRSRSLSLHFNAHFPGEPGLAGLYWSKRWWRWWVVTTGAKSRAKLQSSHHQQTNIQFFTGRMPFLSPNQQCQSTEGSQVRS